MLIRRDFLRLAGATPMVFGLDELFAPQDETPAWVAAAFKRMKETHRYGVVLVVPAAEKERLVVAEALGALLRADDADVREVLGEMVLLCMTPEVAARTVKPGKASRLLLAPDGTRVEADEFAVEDLSAEKFCASFRLLLHGRENGRLKKAATSLLETAPESVKTALERLGSESIDSRDEARGALEAKADTIFALLVWTRLSASSEDVKGGLRTIIRNVMKEPALPYGTESNVVKVPDGCPGCGRTRIAPEAKRILSFLTK